MSLFLSKISSSSFSKLLQKRIKSSINRKLNGDAISMDKSMDGPVFLKILRNWMHD